MKLKYYPEAEEFRKLICKTHNWDISKEQFFTVAALLTLTNWRRLRRQMFRAIETAEKVGTTATLQLRFLIDDEKCRYLYEG